MQAGFDWLHAPHSVSFQFDRHVLGVAAEDFVAENIDTDSTVPLVLDGYDPLTYTATLSFPQAQFNTGILENGN
ncbi:hypothetical protein [Fontivita pretiosa]|uniref:hypothetical protein n=1 Tax=Fontivita pretiosa TaxID=2989684 RepID=UPI003D17662A